MMESAIIRTLTYFFIVFGICLLLNLLLSLREKKSDVWMRTLGWILVIPTFFIAAYFGGPIFLAAVLIVVILGIQEFYFLSEHAGTKAFGEAGTAISVLLPIIAFFHDSETFHKIIVIIFLLILAIPLYKRQIKKDLSTDIQICFATITGILYVGWTSSYLILIRNSEHGLNYFMFLMLLIIINDTFAYYSGKIFGKGRAFELISPGKTIQGIVGGFVITILFAYILKYLLPITDIRHVIALGAVIGLSGLLGDMVESTLKREANVKDSGRLLPGFGGILDRFDSLIFSAPIYYFFLFLTAW